MYIDSHAHLDGPKFDADRPQVLERARAAGLERILAIGNGTGPENLDCALRLAEQHDWIYASVGVHPHEAAQVTEAAFAAMEQLARHPKIIAWGEIGLDYHYDHSPRETQKAVFRRQMEQARAARLPIVIHCRPTQKTENAWDDALPMFREHWQSSGLGGILHCFTGDWKHARPALDMGFYISFAGNVSFPNAENIRESARQVPLDRILIETDSPYLAPVPHRGQRNEPLFVVDTAAVLGQLHGLSKEEIGWRTAANFYKLFPDAAHSPGTPRPNA